MNNVTLIGRLARDPSVRDNVTKFTVAVKRDKDASDFISCVAFGKTAELLNKYFTKGKPVAITGRILTGSYEKDGRKVYTTDVVADRVEFVPADKTETAETAAPDISDDEMPW